MGKAVNRVRAWVGHRLFVASVRVWGEYHEVTIADPDGRPVVEFVAYWDWSGHNVADGYDFECACGAEALRA